MRVPERVIRRVSEATDRTVLELPPLPPAIDPDALQRLVESTSDGHVVFCYAGHEVRVNSEGEICVSETRRWTDTPPPERDENANCN